MRYHTGFIVVIVLSWIKPVKGNHVLITMVKCFVNKKKLEHCGLCDEFPCKLLLNHNGTSLSKEYAIKSNKKRQKELRERAKIGTKEWVKKFE